MERNYEVARLSSSILKNCHAIEFCNGRGDAALGYFSTLQEAKDHIKRYKARHPAENWPYVIIKFQNEKGRIIYIEYTDTYLIEKSFKMVKIKNDAQR